MNRRRPSSLQARARWPGPLRTYGYDRRAATTLFAGLIAAVTGKTGVKAGSVTCKCMPRRRAQACRAFLAEAGRNAPKDLDIDIVMDNASSHKTEMIKRWFAKRPHWHVHFTPTSSSWINPAGRCFAGLADKQIRRGAHRSVKGLIADIMTFITRRNDDPTLLRWTKLADVVLASIERGCQRTLNGQAGAKHGG